MAKPQASTHLQVNTQQEVATPSSSASEGSVILSIIDRLIARSDVDIVKVREMLDLHKAVQAEAARRAFLAAFAELQSDLPAASRGGEGHNKKSYARYEDVATALREPFAKHGFSHRFEIDQSVGDKVKVTTFLGHSAGHVESSSLIMSLDTSGGKTPMHALGSTISYGKRYGLLTVTGIATEDDDDAKGANNSAVVTPEQSEELAKLITETGAEINAVLEHYEIKSLSDLASKYYGPCKAKLVARKQHMAREKAAKQEKPNG